MARYRGRVTGDLIHYLADTGPLVGGGSPAVVTVHGIASRWIDGVRNPAQEFVWRSRVRRALTTCSAVITPSSSSAQDISDVFDIPIENIAVIPHGIEHMKSSSPCADVLSDVVERQLRREFILYVGNIEPRKNLEALVAAMGMPSVRELGLDLVVAGKPAWNFGAAMSAIERSRDVVYLGYVSDSDRNALMRRCRAFVFPSLYEGFGFPVLEALSSGRPVITSDRGSLAEVAGPSYIVEELTSEGIATSIVSAMNDDSWLLSCETAGPAWADQFTWKSSVASHIEVYRGVLGE
ncbi:glycosyltransferase family 4 protein [Rhodococcus sp. NBC_00294]